MRDDERERIGAGVQTSEFSSVGPECRRVKISGTLRPTVFFWIDATAIVVVDAKKPSVKVDGEALTLHDPGDDVSP